MCGEHIHWLALCLFSLLSTCSWCVVHTYNLIGLYVSLFLSTGSWWVVSVIHLIGSMISLLSPPVAGVWWAHTLDCSMTSFASSATCSWGVVRAIHWLASIIWLLSTCSWVCGESIHLIGSMTLSPLHLLAGVWWARYTWVVLLLDVSPLSTGWSWCVVVAYNWIVSMTLSPALLSHL